MVIAQLVFMLNQGRFWCRKNDLNVLYKHRPSVTAIAAPYLLSDRALLLFCIAASVRLFKDPVLGARTWWHLPVTKTSMTLKLQCNGCCCFLFSFNYSPVKEYIYIYIYMLWACVCVCVTYSTQHIRKHKQTTVRLNVRPACA